MAERYFIIPLGARPGLVEAQNYLRRTLPGDVTYQNPDRFHITLLAVEDDKGIDLTSLNVAPDLPPFGVGAYSFRTFDYSADGGYPIYMAVGGNTSLRFLQAALYYKATSLGVKVSATSYPGRWQPHITLGMSRREIPYISSLDEIHLEIGNYILTGADYAQLANWTLSGSVSVQELEKRLTAMTLRENGMMCKPGDRVQWGDGMRGQVESVGEEDPPMAQVQPMKKVGKKWMHDGAKMPVVMSSLSAWQDDLPTELLSTGDDFSISELLAKAPTIAMPADVDLEALKSALGVEKITTATLPIGKVDITSRNNRTYARSSIVSLVRQVNENRPEGRWGHDNDDKPPAVRWLAATLEKDGMAWGLALALNQETANHFLAAKATNSKVGSSIYAEELEMQDGKVVDYRLVGIDLANLHGLVGVPDAAAVPATAQETIVNLGEEKEEMTTLPATDTRVSELTEEQGRLKAQLDAQALEIKALKPQADDLKTVCELLGIPESTDPVKAARELAETVKELKAEAMLLLESSISAIITEKIVVAEVRPIVIEMVKELKPFTKKALDRAVDDVVSRESVKLLLKAKVAEAAGPAQQNQATTPNQTGAAKPLINIPKAEATQ